MPESETALDVQEAFIPQDAPYNDSQKDESENRAVDDLRDNLAKDEELCKAVSAHLQSYFDKYKSDRSDLEDSWKVADWMAKCGQDETLRESERTRTDRQGDKLTKTKAQRIGSTLFFRQVHTLAGVFNRILNSAKDPYTFKPRSNPEIFPIDAQAKGLANEHNLLMRWTRDQENFQVKAIELLHAVVKYTNVPICVRWIRKHGEVLDRWPVRGSDGAVQSTKLERRTVLQDNRPTWDIIPNENFYADQNIADLQKQNAIIITSIGGINDYLENDEYVNTDKINATHVYLGRSDDDVKSQKDLNAGYDGSANDTQTGMFMQFDCHCLLPIDESKSAGKRWDAKKHPPKKYWVTFVGNDIGAGLCLRIERNPDPDDEYPVEMVSLCPDDTDRLYKFGLAGALRGNFTELTTAKAQAIDAKTLQNNRPLKRIRGEVHTADGKLTFGKDKVYDVEKPESLTEFQLAQIPDNQTAIAYLESDSDSTAGTIQAVVGAPMGSRTSASESMRAYGQAGLPLEMMAKYVFHKWLKFVARKSVRMWHLYASDQQIIKITDDVGVYHYVRPVDLFGDFDVEITIVDDYDRDLLGQQQLLVAAQNFLPLFMDVVDKRALGKEVFQRFLKMDVGTMMLPDKSMQSSMLARQENVLLNEGKYVAPTMDEDFDAMLREHEGLRLQYNGLEQEQQQVVAVLDRHIAETKFMQEQQLSKRQVGNLPGMPQNQTPGEAGGNAIAAQMGAMANG